MTMSFLTRIAPLGLALVVTSAAFAAEGEHQVIPRQDWSFGGLNGQYDKAQLQRGFGVYKDVCANCHGLSRIYFRNLVQPGGPEFPEEAVKTLAASWPNKITDGPNDEGQMFDRAPGLPDPIRGPYKNEKEARAAQNGALPPDLSLIAKARNTHHEAAWPKHILLMLGDVVTAYQEGGSDYLYALLTGYHEAPAGVTVNEGMYYNTAFPGHQLAMPPPLSDGSVTYADGTPATAANYAKDVTAFLSWTADPTLNQRKRIGWQVLLYLLVTTVLLYFGKKRVWSRIKH